MSTLRIAALACVMLASCATTAGINKDLGAKWVGKPADDFFAMNGPPANQHRMQDGRLVYVWSKRDSLAIGSPVYCDLRLVVDRAGTLTDIAISGSSMGAWTTSYCNEISW